MYCYCPLIICLRSLQCTALPLTTPTSVLHVIPTKTNISLSSFQSAAVQSWLHALEDQQQYSSPVPLKCLFLLSSQLPGSKSTVTSQSNGSCHGVCPSEDVFIYLHVRTMSLTWRTRVKGPSMARCITGGGGRGTTSSQSRLVQMDGMINKHSLHAPPSTCP